jgi:chromosome segregation ATPase
MSEIELIKLKKEIYHLKEKNADLEAEVEEKDLKLGQLESEYLKMKNETLLITKSKLNQQQGIIKQNVEKAILEERNRYIEIEKNLEGSLVKIRNLEQENKNLELHRKELQVQNNVLKKQIQEYGNKFQVSDFIKEINVLEDSLYKKDKDYQKLVLEWNELCDKMEDVLVENRLLRETAQVPLNYGIDIEKIKIGDRVKIEDYKAKIRLLQKEVDTLETERAQLKNRNLFISNQLEMNQAPYDKLSPEQKIVIAEYAQALYEKREFIIPERYQLLKENEKFKNKIEFLEKQVQNLQTENAFRVYGMQTTRGMINNNNVNYDIPVNFFNLFI